MIKKKIICLVLSAVTVGATMASSVGGFTAEDVKAATKLAFDQDYETTKQIVSKGNLIRNNTFDGGVALPWNQVETYPADGDFDVVNGQYKVTVNEMQTPANKDNRWCVQFRHRGLTIEQGHTYRVTFKVTPQYDCKVYAKIGQQGEPYKEYWNNNWNTFDLKAGQTTTVDQTFTMSQATDRQCEFAFHIAGDCAASTLPYSLSFDDINVYDSQFPGYEADIPEPTHAIRVNQVGYYPNMEKKATVVSESKSPIEWKLYDKNQKVVKTGKTTVFGDDKASGDYVHTIDFSDFTQEGEGYRLFVNDTDAATEVPKSMAFKIGNDLYTQMKHDAIKYFYQNRSGIELKMPYTERADLARPAGHPSDIMPTVKTLSDGTQSWYKDDYSLDITGGWYDAGDHGKYVVNGGISTWTMMNQYERAKNAGQDMTKAPFGDNTMNIPESGNGNPDILDESRYNLEALLKMQVPDGHEYAGMVHHKGHDERWTALGVRPDQDKQPRFLQPPSTAATLNLAAIAAQGARLWKDLDPTFAAQCQTAAEKAWAAAEKHPDIFAPLQSTSGGGAYGDDCVDDEFYWAACELYATTGESKYIDYAKSSNAYLQMPTELNGGEDHGCSGAFDWGNVGGLGTLTLVTAPTSLDKSDIQKAKENITKAADVFIANENNQGYGMPINESETVTGVKGLPWGSNSFITNASIVMAYANDFNKDSTDKYINGVAKAMDYILGCNPNVQSYVTGYGTNPLENPHHRFWAYQTDNTFPKAPAGAISGGPNSGLEDPWVKGSGWAPGEMASEKCFMDNIESWATNEVTINWNAPFAWVTSYMDDNNGIAPITDVLYGDLNGDEKINVMDLVLLKKYMNDNSTNIPSGIKSADLNGDGEVSSVDLLLLKKYVSGKLTEFPVQK